jgi:adenylosuccinate lyase
VSGDPAVRAVLSEKDLDEVFRLERYLGHVDAIFARVFASATT